MKKKECINCEFYAVNDERFGMCHRLPPMSDTNETIDYFPQVNPDSWCGEFIQKKVEKVVRQ